jgi:hypothetical protein
MRSAKSVGRTVGLVSLPRGFLAPVVNFALLAPVTAADWIDRAPPHAARVRAGLLVAFALAGLGLAVAVVSAPLFDRYSERMSLAFVALSILACVTAAIEGVAVVGVLAVAQEHAQAGAESLVTIGHVARAAWRWSHFTNLMAGVLAVLAFAATLWRFALVPRLLAAANVVTALVAAVALAAPLLGRPFSLAMLAPLGVAQLALMAWLVVRGFAEREGASAVT